MKTVGGSIHQEYWIPAEELKEFNNNIVGLIEVMVVREGICNSALLHHDKRNAIGQAPVLVAARFVKIPAALEKLFIYMNDFKMKQFKLAAK